MLALVSPSTCRCGLPMIGLLGGDQVVCGYAPLRSCECSKRVQNTTIWVPDTTTSWLDSGCDPELEYVSISSF